MVEAYRPADLLEALQLRSQNNTVLLAGGTDLMVRNRAWSGAVPGFTSPVLFIGHLHELQNISIDNNMLHIGSACTLDQIIQHPLVPDYIKAPICHMASPSVRNLGTMGGNICNGSPAGDTLPMLYALEACLKIQSQRSAHHIPISDFLTGPGSSILQKDEILTEIQIPLLDFNHYYYKKVGARKANAISKVSFFAVARRNPSRILEVRMAFGAVAPTIVRSLAGEAMLGNVDQTALPTLVETVKSHYRGLLHPLDDTRSTSRYRLTVALLILEHFLLKELISY